MCVARVVVCMCDVSPAGVGVSACCMSSGCRCVSVLYVQCASVCPCAVCPVGVGVSVCYIGGYVSVDSPVGVVLLVCCIGGHVRCAVQWVSVCRCAVSANAFGV